MWEGEIANTVLHEQNILTEGKHYMHTNLALNTQGGHVYMHTHLALNTQGTNVYMYTHLARIQFLFILIRPHSLLLPAFLEYVVVYLAATAVP